MFGLFKWSRSRLDLFVKVLAGAAALFAVLCFAAWDAIGPWMKMREDALKLLSYVFGPLFTILGFILGIKDKLELAESAKLAAHAEGRASAEEEKATKQKELAEAAIVTSQRLRDDIKKIAERSDKLWALRPTQPFPEFKAWRTAKVGATTVAFVNLKGGVGKTTLAANFAAYASEHLQKRVLVLDLDYQGSLSNMLLRAVGETDVSSRVEWLFRQDADSLLLRQAQIQLTRYKPEPRRVSLSESWLVPANYSLQEAENALLLSWLVEEQPKVDVRFRLAHLLLNPDVRSQYDLIVFDLPPRLTLGAINALVATEHFFVPTILDGLSAEAVPLVLSNIKSMSDEMRLGISLAGIVGMMTNEAGRGAREKEVWAKLAIDANKAWHNLDDDPINRYVLEASLAKRALVSSAAGRSLVLLDPDDTNKESTVTQFTSLFEEMSHRIGISGM